MTRSPHFLRFVPDHSSSVFTASNKGTTTSSFLLPSSDGLHPSSFLQLDSEDPKVLQLDVPTPSPPSPGLDAFDAARGLGRRGLGLRRLARGAGHAAPGSHTLQRPREGGGADPHSV